MGKKLHIQDIENVLLRHGNSVRIDASTFVDRVTPARFIDFEYGEWWIKPIYIVYKSVIRHPNLVKSLKHKHQITPVSVVCQRILDVHGEDVILDSATYTDMCHKARFIDKTYGEWWATPNNIVRGHGHEKRAYTKMAKNAIKTRLSYPPVQHWKTGELCYSQSSWEYATLLWLTKHSYDFDWQIPIVTDIVTSTGKKATYVVDLHIKDKKFDDLYVEIKGRWFSDKSRMKWDWFHTQYPNSQL